MLNGVGEIGKAVRDSDPCLDAGKNIGRPRSVGEGGSGGGCMVCMRPAKSVNAIAGRVVSQGCARISGI